jgi:hypothetical protein
MGRVDTIEDLSGWKHYDDRDTSGSTNGYSMGLGERIRHSTTDYDCNNYYDHSDYIDNCSTCIKRCHDR